MAPTASASDEWMAVGEIVGPFGIRGQVKVLPLTDFPDRFERTPTVYLGKEHTPRTVLAAQSHKNVIVLTLQGIETANDAERLRGVTVWIPESERVKLPPDQFYLHDVVGLRVEDAAGKPLGVVADIVPGGGSDLYVVRNEATGRETFLPAVKEFIKAIDLAAGVIRVTPIPGLFDDEGETAG